MYMHVYTSVEFTIAKH